jgi:hypothetical protein
MAVSEWKALRFMSLPFLTRSPLGPLGPCGPGSPLSPFGPGRPSIPGNPCCPFGPIWPGGPGGPYKYKQRLGNSCLESLFNQCWLIPAIFILSSSTCYSLLNIQLLNMLNPLVMHLICFSRNLVWILDRILAIWSSHNFPDIFQDIPYLGLTSPALSHS